MLALRYAQWALRWRIDRLRKSAVKYFLFFRSPVVSVPAFAAYCHLPTVFLSGVADS